MSKTQDKRRVVAVTGSSRGIGAGLALGFARAGYRVVINYFESEVLALSLRDDIEHQFGTDAAIAVRADVSDRTAVSRMFSTCLEHFGRVDVLINNAGVNRDRSFFEMTDEDWTRVVSTILTGSFVCSQEFARSYVGEEGHIINIGAVTAIHGRKSRANYCSARAGVLTLTRCLALELAPRIRVNSVTPGWIATEEVIERYELRHPDKLAQAIGSVPLGRLGTPEDVFRIVHFLVSESTYITGQNFFVDGGKLMQ